MKNKMKKWNINIVLNSGKEYNVDFTTNNEENTINVYNRVFKTSSLDSFIYITNDDYSETVFIQEPST